MNTSLLKYAVEVGKTRSITKAAQNLYMGQPNLSKAIRELEQEIGVKIFKRTPKGVIPTQRGREFLGYAEEILEQLNELESLYKPSSGKKLELYVAVPRAAYPAMVFSDFLNRQTDAEDIDIHFRETGANQAVHLVENGDADFGIIRYPSNQSKYFAKFLRSCGLRGEVLGQYRMLVMMSEDHPLADREEIDYRELVGYIEIVHGDYQTPVLDFRGMPPDEQQPDSHMRRITVYDRGSQYILLNKIKGSYLWTSPVPEEILKQHRLVVRPCTMTDILDLDVLIYPAGSQLSPCAEELADGFRKALGNSEENQDKSK